MKRTMMNSSNTITIIPNRLSFTILDYLPNKSKTVFYYSTEDNPAFAYQPFYADFGPNSLLQVHKFLGLTKRLLEREKIPLIYFCTDSPFSITNSIFLISSFSMIYHETSPQKAYEPFRCFENFVRPYRDASSLQSLYDLSIYSCLKGLHKAMKLGWYNPNNFDVLQWEKYEQVPNGDMNWLIPGKLMAFATPYSSNIIQGWKVCTPNDLVPVFKGFKITRIIRLTNKIYDETIFMKNGFKFTELFFEDGTTPPEHILKRFLELMQSDDVIALHCKAGLGRTGTLAACYMMKFYSFKADEAIGWIRICRPGSIIGPQQRYLLWYEKELDDAKEAGETPKSSHISSPSKHLRTSMKKASEMNQNSRSTDSRHGKKCPMAQSLRSKHCSDLLNMAGTTSHEDSERYDMIAFQAEAKKAQPRKKKRAMGRRDDI